MDNGEVLMDIQFWVEYEDKNWIQFFILQYRIFFLISGLLEKNLLPFFSI